jgi:hypothetical protein
MDFQKKLLEGEYFYTSQKAIEDGGKIKTVFCFTNSLNEPVSLSFNSI